MSSGLIASGCLDNGSSQGFQSPIRPTMGTLPINGFSNVNSGIHAVRGPSAGKVSSVQESSKFVDAMKFASIPRFHPHSLPEYHDSLANGSQYKFSSSIGNVSGTIGPPVTEGCDSRHMLGLGSPGKLTDFNGGGMSIGCLCAKDASFISLNFCNCLELVLLTIKSCDRNGQNYYKG